MSESERDLLSRLWEEHQRTPFPPHMRGQAIDGEEMLLLDLYLAGCVSSSLSGPLDEQRQEILLRCLSAVEKVLPSIDDEGGAIEYFQHVRKMAALAVKIGNDLP